ncbi:MAG: PIN domain-containing protein [Nitrospirota bacterium]|nr:PIN domain-containing protein [Nitrospirota bacterium]MDH5587289.1 PIN domain-containing protein [Nitrospirota bacterium]MDH5773923.1 PIN domain-containing protein [Nitrospirota bacterium]
MIAYIDSSVLLRVLFGQSNALKEWKKIERGMSSALIEVECLRTMDRLRLVENFGEEAIAIRREAIFRLLEGLEIIELTHPVLARASQPLPTTLGTLDAIHLATALMWKEQAKENLVMATHDTALALAAKASGLSVIG